MDGTIPYLKLSVSVSNLVVAAIEISKVLYVRYILIR